MFSFVIVLIIWLGWEKILGFAGDFLIRSTVPDRAEAVVVLSGNMPERALAAADLYNKGAVPRIFLTRVRPSPAMEILRGKKWLPTDEEEIGRGILIKAGVPPERIGAIPGLNDGTQDEAKAMAAQAQALGWKQLVVVTSTFHTRRADLALRRAFRDKGVSVIVWGSPYSEFDPKSWWRSHRQSQELIIEYQKLIYYYLVGFREWIKQAWRRQERTAA